MTGDRELTTWEKANLGLQPFGLETVTNREGEPTLYDVALIETKARLDGQRASLENLIRVLAGKGLIKGEDFAK